MAAAAPQGTRTSASIQGSAEDASKSLIAPKDVQISAKAVVPRETELKGEISIGTGTVLHPSAKILAENGPIIIGDGNIVEEKVTIRNRFPVSEDGTRRTLYIGSRNLFEAYSVVEGSIGNYNTVCCKAVVGELATLSTGCVLGSMCRLLSAETLPENTLILGDKHERRVVETSQTPPFIEEHLEYLQRQLQNYHYILKSSV